jgi:hypothetical protein
MMISISISSIAATCPRESLSISNFGVKVGNRRRLVAAEAGLRDTSSFPPSFKVIKRRWLVLLVSAQENSNNRIGPMGNSPTLTGHADPSFF